MGNIYEKCERCVAQNECPAGAMPGSIMCLMKRMQSGKTHGDENRERNRRRCPHCGLPIN